MTEVRDRSPQQIGSYAIIEVIAHGATSEVLKALDTDHNRTVAVKVLSRDLVNNPEVRARFEQESRALTDLEHPNIAKVYATGITPDGRPYFVMEFIVGRSLMDLILDKVEMSLSQQLDLVIQAAEGFHAAFNRNILHCDVKPANLMVEMPAKVAGPDVHPSPASVGNESISQVSPDDRQYHVKIVDFGLAKIIREGAYRSFVPAFVGTPRYVAPEVSMGRPSDHRSDIYSLGATFYHLLTGKPPFDGDTPAVVMAQHISSPLTPPHLLNPQIPADVCEIIERAMAKEPSHRYADYDEMLSDLKAARVAQLARERRVASEKSLGPQRAQTETATPPEVVTASTSMLSATRRVGWRLAILLILVVVGLVGMAYLKQSKARNESQRLLPVLVQKLLHLVGKDKSPDDSQIPKPEKPSKVTSP